jgi:hypothetical protein
MSAPTPLLDFFKRGEVARDVRMQAAQGALAPRALEQMSILILLLEDSDEDVRTAAERTINSIPGPALAAFLARSDAPLAMREFFAARGIQPAAEAAANADDPLIESESAGDADVPESDAETDDPDAARASISQQLANMNFPQRLKAAVKGSREVRAILIRDPNKMISASVLSSPKVSEQEIETFSRMANVAEDILRIIGMNRAWMKNYGIVVGLTKNPKTPLGMSMNLMSRLNDRDLNMLSVDRNVPEALRIAARKRLQASSR